MRRKLVSMHLMCVRGIGACTADDKTDCIMLYYVVDASSLWSKRYDEQSSVLYISALIAHSEN